MSRTIIPLDDSTGTTAEDQATHEAAMTAKAKESGATISRTDRQGNKEVIQEGRTAEPEATPAEETPSAPQRPDNVPEKFWNAETGEVNTEALLKSYTELESAKGKSTEEAPAEEPEADPEETQLAPMEDIQAAASAEFDANGSLSDETYEVLQKRGFSRAMVDQYIAGQQVVAAQAEDAIFTAAGSNRDEYTAAVEWAKASLTAAEKQAFNASLGDATKATSAVKGMVERFRSEGTYSPGTQIAGGTPSSSGVGMYTSRAQMSADMRKPEYKTDATFRDMVQQKIANARLAGRPVI